MRRCGSPSASMSPSNSQPASRCSPTWRSPPSSSGRCRRHATACSWSTARRAAQRLLAGAVRSLDWLARFRIEDGAPGSPPRVVDRDGTARDGAAAVRFALSRLPVTAWFALPTLLAAGTRRGRSSSRPLADRVTRRGVSSARPEPRSAGAAGGGGPARRRRAGVRRAGPAGALPGGHRRRADGTGRPRPSTGSPATRLDDGTWLYEYDAESDRDLGSYNIVRHAGAIMGLYQAATRGDPRRAGERRPRAGVAPASTCWSATAGRR